jgi:hypothetical protein
MRAWLFPFCRIPRLPFRASPNTPVDGFAKELYLFPERKDAGVEILQNVDKFLISGIK